MATIATLNGDNLPEQFSYRPYVPRKRNSVTPTAGAVIVQYAEPDQIVHGDGTIPWTIEAAKPTEFQDLYDLYDTVAPVLYTFTGYWGESLGVYFTSLDQPIVRGRLFSVSGQFQVICINTPMEAVCTP